MPWSYHYRMRRRRTLTWTCTLVVSSLSMSSSVAGEDSNGRPPPDCVHRAMSTCCQPQMISEPSLYGPARVHEMRLSSVARENNGANSRLVTRSRAIASKSTFPCFLTPQSPSRSATTCCLVPLQIQNDPRSSTAPRRSNIAAKLAELG